MGTDKAGNTDATKIDKEPGRPRDGRQGGSAGRRRRRRSSERGENLWQTVPAVVTAAIALGGLAFYAILAVSYSQYYQDLGITLAEVGQSYVTVLQNSVGALIFFAVAFGLLFSGQHRLRELIVLMIIALLFSVILTTWNAHVRANAVKRGDPVLPIHRGPLVVLSVRADPVIIKPVDKLESGSALAGLMNRPAGKPFLYIGQANGSAVFYDSIAGKSIHVPISSVVLSRSNCSDKKSPDPVCKRTFRSLL